MPKNPKTTKSSRKKGHKAIVIAGIFVSVWSLCAIWFHQQAGRRVHAEESSPRNAKDIQVANSVPQPKQRLSSPAGISSWEGWQLLIARSMECKWEKCLEENHGCKTCRDEEDMGPAPSVTADWKPDETMLHRMFQAGKDNQGNPWPPPLGGDLCDNWWGGIYKDINKRAIQKIPLRVQSQSDKPTLFCGIYTMEPAHSKTIRAMRETWAPRCNGFLAFSTKSDPRIPALDIQHQGAEEYTNMWQKSRAIWKYIGENYLDRYDYFILGGEDLFLLVDNLRAYLATLPGGPEADHFVGRRFKGPGPNNYFNSGGAGYVLSRATLRKYIQQGFEHPDCAPNLHTAMEDVMMAQCLRRVFKIGLTDTRDAQGRERFHPFAPGSHLTWQKAEPGKEGWYGQYNQEWGLKYGKDCCAPGSVTFHSIKKGAMVRHLHSLLYECGKLPLITD